MAKKKVYVRMQVTVEIDVTLENWNENSNIDQVYREGSEKGIATITELCRRYVRLIGKPKVEAIITESDR